MRQVEEKAGSSMNVKETEECKDMFDVITFRSPSVWRVLEVQNMCVEGRKGGGERGMKGERKGWREEVHAFLNHLYARKSQPLIQNIYISFSQFQLFSLSTQARKEVRRGKERFSFGSAAQGSLPPASLP